MKTYVLFRIGMRKKNHRKTKIMEFSDFKEIQAAAVEGFKQIGLQLYKL